MLSEGKTHRAVSLAVAGKGAQSRAQQALQSWPLNGSTDSFETRREQAGTAHTPTSENSEWLPFFLLLMPNPKSTSIPALS